MKIYTKQLNPLPGGEPTLYPRVRVGSTLAFGMLCEINEPCEHLAFMIRDFRNKQVLENEWSGFRSTLFLPQVIFDRGGWIQLSKTPYFAPIEWHRPDCPPIPLKLSESSPPLKPIIDSTIEAIRKGSLEKAVIASRVDMKYQAPLSSRSLLSNLYHEGSTPFLYEIGPSRALIGATPEKLYTRRGSEIHTEALAGTAFHSETLNTEKNIAEFDFVSHDIEKRLASLCDRVTLSELQVKKTEFLQHLHREFAGTLKEGIDDFAIIDELNPTPAMGGYPREKALDWIEQNEAIERGFYSSVFGFLSKERADIFVAIRCALIDQETLSAFGGAGLVKDSEAEDEIAEIESKIAMWRELS